MDFRPCFSIRVQLCGELNSRAVMASLHYCDASVVHSPRPSGSGRNESCPRSRPPMRPAPRCRAWARPRDWSAVGCAGRQGGRM